MVNLATGLRHPTAKLAVLMSGNVLMTFMISSVMPASGAIAQNFSALGAVEMHAQILLLAPFFALIFVAPLSGTLTRNYGRRLPLLVAIAIYAVAGAAELFTNSFWWLVAERILLGVGGGGITTICMTLAGDYFVGARQTWAVALVGMASAPGSVLVLLISGVLVDWGGWHRHFSLCRFFSRPFSLSTNPRRPRKRFQPAARCRGFFGPSAWSRCLRPASP